MAPCVLSLRELQKRQMDQLPRLLRNLHELHSSGIVVRDLKSVKYIDGQLVDFSHAWTIPHIFDPEGGVRPRWVFESMAALDLKCFQQIIDRCGYSISTFEPPLKAPKVVACRDEKVLGRLQPRAQAYGPFLPLLAYDHDPEFMEHHPPFDPAQFKWKAIQEKSSKTSPRRVTKRKAATQGGKGKARRSKKMTSKKAESRREKSEDMEDISPEIMQE
ncbi:hypothetical protein ACHAPU_004925 [Fusarium lateritium]